MRYALLGTGSRAEMFYNALEHDEKIKKENQLVALLDPVQQRMDYVNQVLGRELPTYKPHQFQEMISAEKVEGLIITTKDAHHDRYIVRGLQNDLKVITEKPMTTDEKKCQQIIDALADSEGELIVTFNYRYSPYRSRIKKMLQERVIGEVTMVEFHWYLDTTHGADYYRRWHRNKHNSGSLLVHKATHHFDLVNWWLDSYPRRVFAAGTKRFYRPETFSYSSRCQNCELTEDCRFFFDLQESDKLKKLYLDAEGEDGYIRDGCVFDPDIDIWDTRAVTATYENSVLLSYSLNNYAPYEGYKVAFVGTEGRIEQDVVEASYISGHDGQPERRTEDNDIRLEVFPLFADPYEINVEVESGGHGGGDRRLLRDIFLPVDREDPLQRKAGGIEGAMSILLGTAARRSIEQERPVDINELVDIPEELLT